MGDMSRIRALRLTSGHPADAAGSSGHGVRDVLDECHPDRAAAEARRHIEMSLDVVEPESVVSSLAAE
ncbi:MULTISPECIES: hypothetical protein [unclassified Pseudonocardia]|jgi:hypothetical protein|uniref:hypothetical protein n=1 Tax=unclassified Pseudonocardia TaxID=2619320 RepID=UPI0009697D69|nr:MULTISPECIES: hypothetical protein [unclassified Pseudonocardia]MBN9098696.1 hypothetical protein [Pseudonocardia sp.]OJY51985.1 MAG: hypothetical protein BGP03_08025 [Pseudonocardia sp. 73-21]